MTVYKNGSSNDPITVNTRIDQKLAANQSADYLDEFLDKCTNGLKLNSIIKQVYNWHGKLIDKNMTNIPTFNNILDISECHVEYSPVWASKSEKFNPSGALKFVGDFLSFEKAYLRDFREYETNIKEGRGKRSFNKREYETLAINHLIHDHGNVYDNLNRLIDYLTVLHGDLTDLNEKYTAHGSNYLMGHIKQVKTTDYIFGGPSSLGLLLQVFLNGSSDLLFNFYFNFHTSAVHSYEINLTQLMDEINRLYHNNIRSSTTKFTRAFKESGDEILRPFTTHWLALDDSKTVNYSTLFKDRDNLKYGEKIWVSAGDNWKFPNEKFVTLTMYSLNILKDPQTRTIDFYAELLRLEDVEHFSKPNCWQCVDLDDILKQLNDDLVLNVKDKPSGFDELCNLKLGQHEISCCIECTERHELILYPKLGFESAKELKKGSDQHSDFDKTVKTFASKWRENNFQLWSFSLDGYICNSFLPQIILTVDTSLKVELEITVKNSTRPVVFVGYCVALRAKNSHNNNQWGLNTKGQIFSKSTGDTMVLTSLHLLTNRLDNLRKKTVLDAYKFNSKIEMYDAKTRMLGATLVVLERFDVQCKASKRNPCKNTDCKKCATNCLKNLFSSQRWAIKEDGSKWIHPDGNFLASQWKYSRLASPEWHRMGYTWPVDEYNHLIEQFKWPINGFLIAGPPPLRDIRGIEHLKRWSLKVLRNGETNKELAVDIILPDVRNLMDKHEHCVHMTLEEAEFHAFLECCTADLCLPFAARRLFDTNGNEHFDLTFMNNKSDTESKYVYVSCGEGWIDTVLSAMEKNSNLSLTKLMDDFKKIYHYCCLIHCKSIDLNIEADSLRDGACLSLQICCLNVTQRERIKQGEPLSQVMQIDDFEVAEEVLDMQK